MRGLGKDVLFAGRLLARSPGFAAAVIFLIAIGTGPTVAIYGIIHAVLLQPLPFHEPDRLAALFDTSTENPAQQQSVSVPDFFDWQATSRSFESLACYHPWFYSLTGDGEPERINGGVMSANLLPTLGVPPLVGRVFDAAEQGPGAKPVVLLGEGLWHRRFGADPRVIGRTVRLDDEPYTVVGVLPAWFSLPKGAELWRPLAHGPSSSPRDFQFLHVVGRLKHGVSARAAGREMSTIAAHLERQFPASNKGRGAQVRPLHEQLVDEVRPALLVIFGAVLLMLALALVNVANLMLVRAEGHRGEIAVRLALGVSRGRLARQFVIEGLLLSLVGCGGAGLLLGGWIFRILVAFSPREVPGLAAARFGGPVLGFALVVAVAASLVFSLFPALWASHYDLGMTLRTATSGSGRGGARRLVGLLVVGQIAASLVLLVGSGLMIESFARLRSVDPGFVPEGLLTMRLSLPETKYREGTQAWLFFHQLEERLDRLPGVEGVAFGLVLPMSAGPKVGNLFTIAGRPKGISPQDSAFIRPVSTAYFRLLRIPLLRGRGFTAQDDVRAPAVAVINQEMARRFFPAENPVGQRMTIGAHLGSMGTLPEVPREIVGVVGDIKHAGLGKEVVPEAYFPLAQGTWRSVAIAVRAAGDPRRLTQPVAQEVWALDPNLPLSNVVTMEESVAASIAQPRFYAMLLTAFAALACILAMAGVYGVVSLAVHQRAHEIGVRMALGAGRPQILRRVLLDGMTLALVGLLLGLLAAGALSRVLEGLLFGTSSRDPGAFLAGAAMIAMAALGASCVPGYRATRVDPLAVLREP